VFERFLEERLYLTNVSPRTIEWYKEAFRWLPCPNPNELDLKNYVLRMRERGLRPVSCRSYTTAVNAYLKWSGSELRIPRMKVEQRVPSTFTAEDIGKLVRSKPKGFYALRLHALVLTLADTGCRIGEVLSLRWTGVDFDNLLLTVMGKGSKERKIPFSFELRRNLYRYKQQTRFELVFAAKSGLPLMRRNTLRDVKNLCKRLGVRAPERTLHAFRHTFALNYLRKGGSVFHLQKVLGHSSLEMTRRYANLCTADLQAVHERCSLLSSR